MPKREYLHEWMHRFEVDRPQRIYRRLWWQLWKRPCEILIVRVWAKVQLYDDDTYPYTERENRYWQRKGIEAAVKHWTHCTRRDVDELLTDIAKLEFVNAVEILDESGNGRLVYVDWP